MRLMSDGEEQPIDKFVRHKTNINEWYKEMKEYNLTQEEMSILEEHLGYVYGVGDSQEIMMLLLMDERICNFSIVEANIARRVVGKKEMKRIPEIKEMVFSKGKGRKNLVQYIWDTQIVPQLGYSFSSLHSTGYSLIALQNMNLAHCYPQVYWNTACLSVQAGADEDNKHNKGTNYGKVASAIGKMQLEGVTVSLPDINKAKFGFTPDSKNNQIIFGLKGITGIGDDVAKDIIENRPYISFKDFLERMYKTKKLKKTHVLQLIKAGAFDEFDTRTNVMRDFLLNEMDKKEKLTLANFNMAIQLGVVPEEMGLYIELFNFRKWAIKQVHERLANPKDKILKLNVKHLDFYLTHFTNDTIVKQDESCFYISDNQFKKEYDKIFETVREWLQKEDVVREFNKRGFIKLWVENAKGSTSKWEMEAVSFYNGPHELDVVDYKKYGIDRLKDIPINPVVVGKNKWNGREYNKYKLHTIVGTVLDRDNVKHTVSLLTSDGVIICKYYSGQFSHYNRQVSKVKNGKKIVLEKSWFTRGNLLMITGFRRGEQFVAKTYSDSPQRHTTSLITEVRKDGSIGLKFEREKGD